MAAAWLTTIGRTEFDVQSAGTDPASAADPDDQQVMREVGVELSGEPPRAVAGLRGADYDVMIVLRPRDNEEALPLAGVPEVMNWSFGPLEDPQKLGREERLALARRMRDELRTRVGLFVIAMRSSSAGPRGSMQ
jgi:protein-tyrosine-phosphatase